MIRIPATQLHRQTWMMRLPHVRPLNFLMMQIPGAILLYYDRMIEYTVEAIKDDPDKDNADSKRYFERF